MDLFNKIFRDIKDDQLLSACKSEDTSLSRLIKEYATYSKRIERLPDMGPNSTGKDLKNAIAMMAPEDIVKLSYHFYINEGTLEDDSSDAADREDRQLKHWTVRALVHMVIWVVLILVGATLAYTFKRGPSGPDDPVIGGLLSTAAEIAKILLSVGD